MEVEIYRTRCFQTRSGISISRTERERPTMSSSRKPVFSRGFLCAAICLTLAALRLFALPRSASAETDRCADAREMLTMINEFRTGKDAWYWNKDNTTWTTETGLSALQYDYALESVALTRARELAVSFSHTRPNGSPWSSAFPAGNYYRGENIAMGFDTAKEAFEGFQETNENYAGQGHRRNMLRGTFTRIGLAAVEIDGNTYWVQEFASGAVVSAGSGSETGWTYSGGKYYYKNADGTWATGWLKDGGAWYYLDAAGAMQTGWQKPDGNWCYFGADGSMATGWRQIGGSWYFFDASGVMQTGWQKLNGSWYHFTASGIMDTGWTKIGDSWYYFGSNGVMETGWRELDGSWYYFRKAGDMATGTENVDGVSQVFGSDGIWQGTEISDYDTPLGDSQVIPGIRFIVQAIMDFLVP